MLGKGEAPGSGAPTVNLKIEYFSRGRPIGWTELARTKPPAASTAAPPTPDVMVRSEHTLGWFRVASDSHALLTEGETLAAKK